MKILDFYADWCHPCKAMKPTVEALEKDFDVTKIDIDADPDTAQNYGVMSIPTLIVLDGDKEVKRFVGQVSETDVRNVMGS